LNHQGISSAAIHGDRNQLQRTQALDSFKHGLIRVLVATDVAARGLDIEELIYVINFELPNSPEDYVHRIGRTGRAGTEGLAHSLVSKEENKLLVGVEKLLKAKIKIEEINGFELKSVQSRILDKDVSVDEKRPRHNAFSVQNRKATSFVKYGKAVIHLNDEIIFKKTKRAEKTDDLLFTQPYISKPFDIEAVEKDELSQRIAHHKKLKQSNRPLPALFISPVIGKQK